MLLLLGSRQMGGACARSRRVGIEGPVHDLIQRYAPSGVDA